MGGLLLLEEQDRSLWDPEQIRLGAEWLARAASGDVFSRFHAEAGIAAEHCFAPSFEETRWQEIAELYGLLERIVPSPLHTLNRAVAVAEWRGTRRRSVAARWSGAAFMGLGYLPLGRCVGGPAPSRRASGCRRSPSHACDRRSANGRGA